MLFQNKYLSIVFGLWADRYKYGCFIVRFHMGLKFVCG